MESGEGLSEVRVYIAPAVMRIWAFRALTKRAVAIPEVTLIAGTRVALGIGVGLLTRNGSIRINGKRRDRRSWPSCLDYDPDSKGFVCETTCCKVIAALVSL